MHSKKFENIKAMDSDERYDYFLDRARDFETVFILTDDDYPVFYSPAEDLKYMPVWPEEAFARTFAKASGHNFKTLEMDLDVFMGQLLPDLEKDIKVGVFPVHRDGDTQVWLVESDALKEHIESVIADLYT